MSNELDYQEQSAQDLRLNVIEGEFDLSQFQIFKTGVLQVSPEISVEAMIIGRSHAICFQVGDMRLYEVFACGEVRTSRSRAFYGPLSEVAGSVELGFHPQVTYGFQAMAMRWPEGTAEIQRMETESVGSQGFYLSYDFPRGAHGDPARTIILGYPNEPEASLRIRTAHSYPNEGTIVISHSGLLTGKDGRAYENEVSVAGHGRPVNNVVNGRMRRTASGAPGPSRRDS